MTATNTTTNTGTTTGTWEIDAAHSVVEFSVRHMMISTVKGSFGAVAGTLQIDEANKAASSVVATIEAASITTGNEGRDQHLRSDDFFNTEAYPQITFRSTSVEPKGENRYAMHGELTMRDVTKPVVLDTEYEGGITDPWGNQRVAFSATTEIVRSEFGANWNAVLETGGVMVSDKVKIAIHIEAVKQA